MTLQTYTYSPKSGGKPKSIVFLLHGLGANGQDLLGLAPIMAEALPDTVFVAPDAPFPCDMAPVGFQWFSLQDWSPLSLLQGTKEAEPILNDFISQTLQHYDLTDDKAALLGFSQGTMMSLFAGPRRAKKLAGILGYSGALVGGEGLGGANIQKMPVHLIHGNVDMVVPVQAYYMAKTVLEHSGFPVTGQIINGLSHGIDDEGIESGTSFLKGVLTA